MIKVDWNQNVLTNDGVSMMVFYQWWCLSMMVFSMIIDVCLPWCSFSNFLRVDWNSWVLPWTTRPVGGKRCLGTSVFTVGTWWPQRIQRATRPLKVGLPKKEKKIFQSPFFQGRAVRFKECKLFFESQIPKLVICLVTQAFCCWFFGIGNNKDVC